MTASAPLTESTEQNVSTNLTPPMMDETTQFNLKRESCFSAFNGIFVGMTFISAPVLARTGIGVNPLELTILCTAFPLGAWLGPVWAWIGRRLGMLRLVVHCELLASMFLMPIFLVSNTLVYTLLIAGAQLLISPIRMGQSSNYSVNYHEQQRGRILGRFVFWTFLTMVPSILLAGYLINLNRENYRLIYPFASICGLFACFFYSRLRLPAAVQVHPPRMSIRGGVDKVKQVFRENRGFRYFQIAFFISGSAFFMSNHVVLLLVEQRFQLNAAELTLWLSVVPQILLAIGSPFWGRILDRFGVSFCRFLIAITLTVYLFHYFLGIWMGILWLIFIGSILQGTTNAGGQLTWYLGSSHYAPTTEEVPTYHGIHLFLNGTRGLLMPWVGLQLYFAIGHWAVLIGAFVSFLAVPVTMQLMKVSR